MVFFQQIGLELFGLLQEVLIQLLSFLLLLLAYLLQMHQFHALLCQKVSLVFRLCLGLLELIDRHVLRIVLLVKVGLELSAFNEGVLL